MIVNTYRLTLASHYSSKTLILEMQGEFVMNDSDQDCSRYLYIGVTAWIHLHRSGHLTLLMVKNSGRWGRV